MNLSNSRCWTTLGRSMPLILSYAFLLLAVRPGVADEPAPFSRVELHQSGGFIGIDVRCTIQADGSYSLTSRRGGDREGQLSDEQLTALTEAVVGLDWDALENPRRPGGVISDGFTYELTLIVDDQQQHVRYGQGTTFEGDSMQMLRIIFRTLATVQAQRN